MHVDGDSSLEVASLGGLLLVAGVVFCTGITWGLPSKAAEPFLFAARGLVGREDPAACRRLERRPRPGRDVDVNPLAKKPNLSRLTRPTPSGGIIRRYRLYSYQPDEMITLRALAGMPRARASSIRGCTSMAFVIYPVGALLKLASVAGLVTLKADVSWYLDHPEEFGRFYVSLDCTRCSGTGGRVAIVWIARRLAGGGCCPLSSQGCAMYACRWWSTWPRGQAAPAGAVLQVLAIMASMRYVETGRRAWWLTTAVLCGRIRMVLSAWPVFIVLPLMVLLRPDTWMRRRRWPLGGLAGAGVYLLANLTCHQPVHQP